MKGENLMKELLDVLFTEHCINNYKPSWLEGLEIDRYYPSLRTAFEYQGEQHFEFYYGIHDSHQSFFTQIKHDQTKKEKLNEKNICLIEISRGDLTPDIFCKKLKNQFLYYDSSFKFEEKLVQSILNYQKSIEVHYKKQFKNIIERSYFLRLSNIPHLKKMIDKHLFTESSLTQNEKLLFCLMTIFSKNNEMILTFSQLMDYVIKPFAFYHLHNENMHSIIQTLVKSDMIHFHPVFELVTLSEKYSLKTLDFIEKIITFIERKNGKL